MAEQQHVAQLAAEVAESASVQELSSPVLAAAVVVVFLPASAKAFQLSAAVVERQLVLVLAAVAAELPA